MDIMRGHQNGYTIGVLYKVFPYYRCTRGHLKKSCEGLVFGDASIIKMHCSSSPVRCFWDVAHVSRSSPRSLLRDTPEIVHGPVN